MHYQTLTNDQLIDRFKAYKDLPPLSDLQNEALVWLTHSIYRMEVRYISKLVVRKSETAIDVDLLANDATYEFLDRYLIGRHSNLNACEQVLHLLKKIARSKVVNAIRDSRRRVQPVERLNAIARCRSSKTTHHKM